ITVTDIVHGEISVNLATLDDFVLLKSDGFPTYHLAHVVDDHAMQTTHVIRGDEWLSSLPKHVLLFRALNLEPPQYAHLALLHNAQHKKLSKRDGDVSVESFLAWCLPEALVNFVALLGWNVQGDQEIYTMPELVAAFGLSRVHRAPAVVDFQKLEWMNGEYLRVRAPAEIIAAIRATGITMPTTDEAFMERVLVLEQPRMKRLDALPAWYFAPYQRDVPLAWKNTDAAITKSNLEAVIQKLETIAGWGSDTTPAELESIVKPWITERGLGVGEVLWPVRVALSGQKASPSPFDLAWLYGKDETIRRLQHAIATL
ncbi:MAG: glutamate--tRNA ligase family protein, partial [bacterium]|nr:glutamate--tRNA ligase family protein [bacterium]